MEVQTKKLEYAEDERKDFVDRTQRLEKIRFTQLQEMDVLRAKTISLETANQNLNMNKEDYFHQFKEEQDITVQQMKQRF